MHIPNKKGADGVLTKNFLAWRDVADLFSCGKSKAMLIMNEVGPIHVGQVSFVRSVDLQNYIAEHGEIRVTWPMSAKRRRERRHD